MRHPVDFAVQVLARNLQWIAAADGKVGPNLAISTAMVGILAAIVPIARQRTSFSTISVARFTVTRKSHRQSTVMCAVAWLSFSSA